MNGVLPLSGSGGVFRGTPTNVLVSNNNSLGTSVDGDPDSFAIARLTNALTPPDVGYDSNFVSASTTNAIIKCVAPATQAYRLDFSGTVTANNPLVNDGFLIVKVESSLGLGNEFTGGVKPYLLGPGVGGVTSSVGFNITIFGEVANGEALILKLASNNADTLTVTDLITVATVIRP